MMESHEEAVCECNHLDDFTIVVVSRPGQRE